MKKAMFFSLSACILIIFAFVLFKTQSAMNDEAVDFNIKRIRLSVADHFVRDFDRIYIPNMLKISSKQAIENLTASRIFFDKNDLLDVMIDGDLDGTDYLETEFTLNEHRYQALRTLTFPLDDQALIFDLVSIEQTAFDKFELTFSIDYLFEVFGVKWTRENVIYKIPLYVYSFYHPLFNDYIDRDWVINSTLPCLLDQIAVDGEPCSGFNIMPS